MHGTNKKITMFYTQTHIYTHMYVRMYIYTRVFFTHSCTMETKSLSGGISDSGVVFSYTPKSSAEVKNGRSYNSTFPLCLQWHVTEWPAILHRRFIFVIHEMVK